MIIAKAYCILSAKQTQLDSAKRELIYIFRNGSVRCG